jgi:hypothetical protein
MSDVKKAKKYEYDLMKAYAACGRASYNALLRRNADRETPDAPTPQKILDRISKRMNKNLTLKAEEPSTQEVSDLNPGFCIPCQLLLDGNGPPVQSFNPEASGAHYGHWNLQLMRASAALECPLCVLIFLNVNSLPLDPRTCEDCPGNYEYLTTGHDGSISAVRFNYCMGIKYGEGIRLYLLQPIIITFEKKICMYSVYKILSNFKYYLWNLRSNILLPLIPKDSVFSRT